MAKSDHGYRHWGQARRPPRGHESVKGVGKLRPNWMKNLQHKKTLIPCGETERDTRHQKYELDYNEYMVFNHDQIKVKFAVEVEISSSTLQPQPRHNVQQ